MKIPFSDIVERARVLTGPYGSCSGDLYGAFAFLYSKTVILNVMANSASPDSKWWEHVSVSLPDRAPTWEEMSWIKDLFWKEEECVVQYHPPRSQYVNYHPFCLHLWRPTRKPIPMPPSILVGPK
jgi:hypothetical protein